MSGDASDPPGCRDCRALEARVAELERALVAAGVPLPGTAEPSLPDRPPEATEGSPRTLLELKALRVVAAEGWGAGWALRPSPQRRRWMNENPNAYHCLPLVIANQWGWQVLCPTDVQVTWDGSPAPGGLSVEVDPRFAQAIKSQFGSGIVTFSPPWLFRTSSGWDLYVKGPSNRWKANCVPLEGVIETWWLNYTFTLNWKLVEPGVVGFAKGESLGQLVPVPHDTFARSTAMEAPVGLIEPQAGEELLRWREERRRIAAQPTSTHRLYRKAEGIDAHLQRVAVPELEPFRARGEEARDEPAHGQP